MTFLEAWERSRGLKESHTAAVDAIITGLNVSEDFWDNFILVCNNKGGMADLLNVTPEKIASWPAAISSNLNKSKSGINSPEKEKGKLIDTGNPEEAI